MVKKNPDKTGGGERKVREKIERTGLSKNPRNYYLEKNGVSKLGSRILMYSRGSGRHQAYSKYVGPNPGESQHRIASG